MTREPETAPPAGEQLALRARLERLHLHGEGVVRLAKSPALVQGDLPALAREAAELTAEALEVERVSVWLLTADRDRLDCLDLFERGPRRHERGMTLAAHQYPRYFQSLEQGRAIDANDARHDPRTREFARGYLQPLGITSMLDAGIRVGGRIVGVLCHEHVGEPRVWSEEELAFAAAVADQLASAVVNAERLQALSELRESERRLEQANAMLRLVLDSIPVRVFWKDRESRYLGCNAHFAHDAGRERADDLIGETDFEMGWAEQAELYRADDRQVVESGQPKVGYEEPQTTPEGQRIWLRTSKLPLRDADGAVIGVLGTYEDITERKATEEELADYRRQLEVAQRLESIGRLAGGLAHDLNNMLQPILGYSELLLGELPEGDPGHEFVSEIRMAGQRARDLTTRLLAFGRKQVLELRAARLDDVVEMFQKILRHAIRENVELCFDLRSRRVLRCDVAQLEQVLLNLALNAADAMPRGGRLTVATADVCGAGGEPRVELVVSDGGTGMDEHTREHIFEPFFSTKGTGGTGLGLSVVLGIVEQHGGAVVVESAPGQGTRVAVTLPAVDGPAPEVALPREVSGEAPRRATPRGTETLLVVEDEPLVRRMTSEFLRGLGYDVLEAADAERALELVHGRERSVDLLLSDVVLPGSGGPALLRLLSGRAPALRALFISGHAADAMAAAEGLPEGVELVRKPFSPHELGERVRAALDR